TFSRHPTHLSVRHIPPTRLPAGRGRRPRHARPARRGHQTAARQRLLRPSHRARLPLRDDLRVLHDVLHHHRAPTHHPSPTRRRRRKGANPATRRLRHPAQTTRRHPRLTPITHISRGFF